VRRPGRLNLANGQEHEPGDWTGRRPEQVKIVQVTTWTHTAGAVSPITHTRVLTDSASANDHTGMYSYLSISMSKGEEGASPETQAALRRSTTSEASGRVLLDSACKGHFLLIIVHTV
jgi:hypothetical protein